MNIRTEQEEAARLGFVQAALQEASRYAAETDPPADLIAASVARHRGARARRVRAARLSGLAACAALFAGALLAVRHARVPVAASMGGPGAGQPALAGRGKGGSAGSTPAPSEVHGGVGGSQVGWAFRSWLHPIDVRSLAGHFRYRVMRTEAPPRRGIPFHAPLLERRRVPRVVARLRRRRGPLLISRMNGLGAAPAVRAASVWSTEIVQYQVVTEQVTPVWIAQPDSAGSAVLLTPALFSLSLQPDEADPSLAQVSARIIPVQFQKETTLK